MDFFIKKGDTLPEVKFPLTQKLMDKLDITDDLMENAAVTFSMINNETGLYVISNLPAEIIISDGDYINLNETKYTLSYRFREKDSKKVGFYSGNFTLDFLD